MDLEVAVIGVGLAGEQAFQLLLGGQRRDPGELGLGIGQGPLIVLRLRQLDQADRVVEPALDLADVAERLLELGALAHQRLRLGRVVPERRILGAPVQLVETTARFIPVKETSSAVPATA